MFGADRCVRAADGGYRCPAAAAERLSWYYDASTAACVQFIYAGCGGNDNRFATELDCRAACVGVHDDSVPRGLGTSNWCSTGPIYKTSCDNLTIILR